MDYESAIRQMAKDTNADQRHHCPACRDTRRNKLDRSLSIKLDGNGILFNCWHCELSGKIGLSPPPQRSFVAPTTGAISTRTAGEENPVFDIVPVIPARQLIAGNPMINYLASRGITRRVATDAGVLYEDSHLVGGKYQRVIGFPYLKDGKTYAVKWRGIDDKAFSQTGAAQTLWGLERIQKGQPLTVAEGECDALALWQAGIPAVSVPNGAPQKVSEGRSSPTEDKKYAYLWAAKELIEAAPKVIIATDNDGPGEALGEEIARRIGRAKCWKASWPEGHKDANDVLRAMGAAVLRDCIQQAQPWPVKGLYSAVHFADGVNALYDKGLVRGQSTGFAEVDSIYTVMPGQLTIVTGIPSMGKSSFVDQMLVNLAKREGWKFAICSFENEPRIHIAKLMQLYLGKPFFEGPTPRMTKSDKQAALAWVNEHFSFLYQGDGNQASIEDILDRIKSAVLRYGIRGAVVDPANYIDRDRDMTETDWVSDMLTKIKIFTMAHDLHFWMVSHPSKMQRDDNGAYRVPDGYSVSGSSHWFNKADMGLTIHRPDMFTNKSDVVVWKSRYNFIGKPGKASLMYEPSTGCYFEPQQIWAPSPTRRHHADLN